MITFSELQELQEKILTFLSDENSGQDMDAADVRKFISESFDDTLKIGRNRQDLVKIKNTHMLSNQDKNLSDDDVKSKVNEALKLVSKNASLDRNMVKSVEKMPRTHGQTTDAYKLELSTDWFEDAKGNYVYASQKLISGIAEYNKLHPTRRLFCSAFAPTSWKNQAIAMNDIAREIRAKNQTKKWFTRLSIDFKNLRLLLKVRPPGKTKPWQELDKSTLDKSFITAYQKIFDMPLTPYVPKKLRGGATPSSPPTPRTADNGAPSTQS